MKQTTSRKTLLKKAKRGSVAPTTIQHIPVPVSRNLAKQLIEDDVVFSDPENYRALWFGMVLTFSEAQLVCWQVLWDNFLRGNLPLPQGRMLAAWHGESCQVSDIFKRHKAWRTVIVGDRKGNLWLHVPSGYLPKPTAVAPPSESSGTVEARIHA